LLKVGAKSSGCGDVAIFGTGLCCREIITDERQNELSLYIALLSEGEPQCQASFGGGGWVAVANPRLVDICLEEETQREVLHGRVFCAYFAHPGSAARRHLADVGAYLTYLGLVVIVGDV
jgi:hypothetical protein